METLVKNNVNVQTLKSDIKVLVEKQKIYRNQRKTVYIVGDRTINPSEATELHRSNGEKLRIMYAVYGLLRGKSYSQVENNHPEEGHPLNKYQYDIDKLMKVYEAKE
jgi:hypothetical protein